MAEDIIVIGAGPAGLMAAYELSRAGRKVVILEARDRIGGRAYTMANGIETGAEFVHGALPATLSLLQQAGLGYTVAGGEWVQLSGGDQGEAFDDDAWPAFLSKLGALDEDMSLQDFLTVHFPDNRYAALKVQAIGYAEGYDTADASRVSAKALYEEWNADEEDQYRIDKGYSALMDWLAEQLLQAGCSILLNHEVTEISAGDRVVSITTEHTTFEAAQVVVALPLGVLQADGLTQRLVPNAQYQSAIMQLGYGDVIKFILRFSTPFWEEQYPGLGFLISAAPVPTWWTQAPKSDGVLTGWMAGRAARAHMGMTADQLRRLALESLVILFSKEYGDIEAMLEAAHTVNWSADPYTRGAYAYATVGSGAARQLLARPLKGRIFFAGEYMYAGPAMGTVEAAFLSAQRTVAQIAARE